LLDLGPAIKVLFSDRQRLDGSLPAPETRNDTKTIDEPTQQITPASRRRAVRIEKPRTVKVVGDRAIVIARHLDRILMR
jgi:hypothetical protein